MPFLLEEVWHAIKERTDDIAVADCTENTIKNQILSDFEVAAEVISGIEIFENKEYCKQGSA